MTIVAWGLSWFVIMGLPNYLFSNGKTTYYGQPVRNSVWYLLGISWLSFLFLTDLGGWLAISEVHLASFGLILFVWLFIWKLYLVDQYSSAERWRYQVTKIFDILFQQLFFLTGVLLFPEPWYIFGFVFFLLHTPVPFILPWKFGLLTMIASLPGGLLFAYLYSKGIHGGLAALVLHFGFYAALPFVAGTKLAPNFKPIRR